MTRLLGAVLVTAGCAVLGLGAVGRLDGRVRDLGELAAGLDAITRELGWRLTPLPQALELAAGSTRGPAAAFFARCARQTEEQDGRAFCRIWEESLSAAPLRLTAGDRDVLVRLGPVLGRYDGDSQCHALEDAAAGLRALQGEALDARRRLGRVYGVLGVTAGLLLAILLI